MRKALRQISQTSTTKDQVAVTTVSLISSDVDDAMCKLLGAAFEKRVSPYTVQVLNLQKNNIGNDGIRALCRGLDHHSPSWGTVSAIRCLNLQHNHIGVEGASDLGKLVVSNTSALQELNLSYANLGNEGIVAFANELLRSTMSADGVHVDQPTMSLESLDLTENKIGEVGVQTLAKAFAATNGLQELSLSRNQLGSQGATLLCQEALSNCPQLRKLNLSKNKIGPPAGGALAENLPSSLQILDLSHNLLGDEGIQSLMKMITLNDNTNDTTATTTATTASWGLRGITKLDVSCNGIGDVGAIALASGLQHTATQLEELVLWNNRIRDDGAIAFAQQLTRLIKGSKTNTKSSTSSYGLRKLQLSHNLISNQGATHLATAIQKNPYQLTELALEKNEGITFEGDSSGAQAFLNVLRSKNGGCHLSFLRLGNTAAATGNNSIIQNEIQFYLELNILEKKRHEEYVRRSRLVNSRRISRSQGSLLQHHHHQQPEQWLEQEHQHQLHPQEGLVDSLWGSHRASVRTAVYV
eukprot:CAMPEP_0195306190 /NCGR_PEP_ID=MMETSP0707-20130614/37074_1 /TAXON_ID=33640 /ORGANISM="Asterionellopsis glacialis, Strain CCMP134" /LENGTH=525 /DNA_ID=CAMNT_0040370401 /DNA_START=562 /DNA_END=2139 /DNA_ORIENTATION=-